jgi:hypothetical protein
MNKVHMIQFVIVAMIAAAAVTMAMAIPEEHDHSNLSYLHKTSQMTHQDSRMLMPKTPKSKSLTKDDKLDVLSRLSTLI